MTGPMTTSLRHLVREEGPARIDLLAEQSLTDEDAILVFDCLLERVPSRRILDGTRSVIIPSGGSGGLGGIKIKGAGLHGGLAYDGEAARQTVPFPRYDAEGAATIDAAKNHGRACAGGMSYQQARHEYIVSRISRCAECSVCAPLRIWRTSSRRIRQLVLPPRWPRGGVNDWWA